MSKFFRTKTVVRVLPGIPLDKDFHCPACGRGEKNVVLVCSRCWQLLPKQDRASLRRMTLDGLDTRSKLAKCVAFLKEKLKLA